MLPAVASLRRVPPMLVKRIAELCYEANRIYCESHGDMSHVSWDDAPEWQRGSTTKGVLFVASNLAVTPEDTHASWLKEKLKDGWVYGPVKDADLKEHPCCVPYAELPAMQKAKDELFTLIVKTIAKHG